MPSLSVIEGGLSREAVERLSADRNEPQWLLEKRRQGWEAFERLPTPDWSRGIRGWWNAALHDLKLDTLQAYASAGQELPDFSRETDAATAGTLIQYNSQTVQAELSAEAKAAGVVLCSLEEAVKTHPELVQKYFMTRCVPVEENRFTALHAALWTGGAFLYVPKGVELKAPFRTIFFSDVDGLALFTHTLIVADTGAKVRLIEDQISTAQTAGSETLDSGVTEVFLGEGASVEYYNAQEYDLNLTNFSVKRAMVGRDATHTWVIATLGSAVTRLTLESFLEGQGSHAEVVGLSFSTGQQNFDVSAKTVHGVSHTSAQSIFKSALDDQSQLGFRGAIRTLKGAQHTDSFLNDHTLYLSEDSKADVLPSLDVDANDVRCSHGASIGMIDEEQIFYLMSRGLPRIEAERTIVAGFFEEGIERVPLESVQERLRQAVADKLH
jgi:FeS assembly protein SufB